MNLIFLFELSPKNIARGKGIIYSMTERKRCLYNLIEGVSELDKLKILTYEFPYFAQNISLIILCKYMQL